MTASSLFDTKCIRRNVADPDSLEELSIFHTVPEVPPTGQCHRGLVKLAVLHATTPRNDVDFQNNNKSLREIGLKRQLKGKFAKFIHKILFIVLQDYGTVKNSFRQKVIELNHVKMY